MGSINQLQLVEGNSVFCFIVVLVSILCFFKPELRIIWDDKCFSYLSYARSPEQYGSQYKSIYTKLWHVHFDVKSTWWGGDGNAY